MCGGPFFGTETEASTRTNFLSWSCTLRIHPQIQQKEEQKCGAWEKEKISEIYDPVSGPLLNPDIRVKSLHRE